MYLKSLSGGVDSSEIFILVDIFWGKPSTKMILFFILTL